MDLNITRGQYMGKAGLLTRLDPRCKLYILILYVILVLFSRDVPMLACSSAFLFLAWIKSGVQIMALLKSARGVLVLLVISELFSLIWADPATVGITFWRLLLITFMSVLFSKTTEPRDILDGLRSGFPITEGAAMSFAIAFDFLPQLGREMEELKAAAVSRGAALEDGSILERIRDYLTLLIPLFRKTLKHAGQLGDAMDLRGYDAGVRRTRMEPLKFKRVDHLAFLVFALFAVLMLVWRFAFSA